MSPWSNLLASGSLPRAALRQEGIITTRPHLTQALRAKQPQGRHKAAGEVHCALVGVCNLRPAAL